MNKKKKNAQSPMEESKQNKNNNQVWRKPISWTST
jgi:hypothetical protein